MQTKCLHHKDPRFMGFLWKFLTLFASGGASWTCNVAVRAACTHGGRGLVLNVAGFEGEIFLEAHKSGIFDIERSSRDLKKISISEERRAIMPERFSGPAVPHNKFYRRVYKHGCGGGGAGPNLVGFLWKYFTLFPSIASGWVRNNAESLLCSSFM